MHVRNAAGTVSVFDSAFVMFWFVRNKTRLSGGLLIAHLRWTALGESHKTGGSFPLSSEPLDFPDSVASPFFEGAKNSIPVRRKFHLKECDYSRHLSISLFYSFPRARPGKILRKVTSKRREIKISHTFPTAEKMAGIKINNAVKDCAMGAQK